MTSTTSTLTVTSGVIEHIDPNQIIVESNVRTSIPLTREFVASIREKGGSSPRSSPAGTPPGK
jgi:anti-sigma-K factor RskA